MPFFRCDFSGRMAQDEEEFQPTVGILEFSPLQQTFGYDHQPALFETFPDRTVNRGFLVQAFSAGKLGESSQHPIRTTLPDEVATMVLDDGDPDSFR